MTFASVLQMLRLILHTSDTTSSDCGAASREGYVDRMNQESQRQLERQRWEAMGRSCLPS